MRSLKRKCRNGLRKEINVRYGALETLPGLRLPPLEYDEVRPHDY
jgi:hypothetical protein